MQYFLLEDVPSPEDFPPPSIAPGLRELDEALRCNICKEVYSAPVTISCGHCFCSLCIRQELPQLAKQECPLCRAPTNESHIRRNTKMEDAVRAWTLARPLVLDLLKEQERRRVQREEKSRTPPPINGYRNSVGQASPKKRKRSPLTEDEDDVVEITASELQQSNISDKGKQRSSKYFDSSPPSSSDPPTPVEAPCPICQKVVPTTTINAHIDSNCKKYLTSDVEVKQKQKDGWGKVFGNAEAGSNKSKGKARSKEEVPVEDDAEPLPKASYGTLKLKRLKELLQEHDLSTVGEREVLEARHQRWVITFNANLDSSQRKPLAQLRKDLIAWEKTKQSKRLTISDDKAYERENKGVYAELIARARATAPKSRREEPRSSPIIVDDSTDDTCATLAPSDVMNMDARRSQPSSSV